MTMKQRALLDAFRSLPGKWRTEAEALKKGAGAALPPPALAASIILLNAHADMVENLFAIADAPEPEDVPYP